MLERTTTFESDGVAVTIECFETGSEGERPAIVALHGSGGMRNGAPMLRTFTRPVVDRGFCVYVPHYFERTDTTFSDPATSRRHFAAWMKTVADAVSFVATQPASDPERIGVIGFSLGAFLGLSVASQDHRIKAVVDFFGGLPEPLAERVRAMPPTLILHGDDDVIVSVEEAYKLERSLASLGAPHEVRIYPGEGHLFSPLAGLDAAQRTLAFLEKHLARGKFG